MLDPRTVATPDDVRSYIHDMLDQLAELALKTDDRFLQTILAWASRAAYGNEHRSREKGPSSDYAEPPVSGATP